MTDSSPSASAASRAQSHQAAADKAAASQREAGIKSASDALAEQRAKEDEAIAEARKQEDSARAAARREADRQLASARTRLVTAAAALQESIDAVPGTGIDEVRVANSELQAAVVNHLSAHPEPSPAAG